MASINAFLNGRFLPVEEACINVEDRGSLFGDGVYEYVRVSRGNIFQAAEHLERLWRSATAIEITVPYSREEITGFMAELVRLSGVYEAGIYIQLTRGTAHRTHHFPNGATPNFFMVARDFEPIPPSCYTEGVSLTLLPDERWKRCDIKTLNLLPNVLAKEKARRAGFYDAVLYSELGITESTSSSVLTVMDGVLTTTPQGPWILPGVTRNTVLTLAREDGIPVSERFFTADELHEASEVMITSTRIDVMPVCSIDGRPVGDGRPGPVCRRLSELFCRLLP